MKRNLAPFLLLAFALYGFWRLMFDWFGSYIRAACVYIDTMGAGFWLCLVVAGALTLAMSVRRKR